MSNNSNSKDAQPPTPIRCEVARSTLYMIGCQSGSICPFCKRPTDNHAEHDQERQQAVAVDGDLQRQMSTKSFPKVGPGSGSEGAPPQDSSSGSGAADDGWDRAEKPKGKGAGGKSPADLPSSPPLRKGENAPTEDVNPFPPPYADAPPAYSNKPPPAYAPPPAYPSDTYSGREWCSLIFGWILTLVVAGHLVAFPFCSSSHYRAQQANYDQLREGVGHHREGSCGSYYESNAMFWVTLVFYVIYLIEAACSPTRQCLSHVLPNVESYLQGVIRSKPRLWFRIECYHYQTRYHSKTESDGSTKTSSTREKVITHQSEEDYLFAAWRDVSGSVTGPTLAPVKRMRCFKSFIFSDPQAKMHYDMCLEDFVRRNNWDWHRDVTTGIDIPGFHDFALTYRTKPPYFSLTHFWVTTLLLGSMFYRHYFYSKTMGVDFNCVKEICSSSYPMYSSQDLNYPMTSGKRAEVGPL